MKKKILELINPRVQSYAESFSSPEDGLLREINDWTAKNHKGYQMLSGHLQGKVLEMISCMVGPRRILEIGTFTGYSALCLAKGLSREGRLHTIELRDHEAGVAQGFFDRSSFKDRIILHRGRALDILPALEETWDLVFLDADKPAYIDYFEHVFPRVRKNGFILADNVFFHGEALADEPKEKNALGIKAYNQYIRNRNDIETVILTLRDGLSIVRKL